MKSYLHILKSSKKSQQAHLCSTTQGQPLSPQFPQCFSRSSRFPTSLSRPIFHPSKKPRTAVHRKKDDFDPMKAPAFLRTEGGESTLQRENSGYLSPRLFKTTLRENAAAGEYISSRKIRRNKSYSGRFPAAHLGSFSDIYQGRRTSKAPAVPQQEPMSVRQLFYRPPPTGPNSIYYAKAETQRPEVVPMALVARKLL